MVSFVLAPETLCCWRWSDNGRKCRQTYGRGDGM